MPDLIERFVVRTGDADRFDVLEGTRMNGKPLTRTEAYRLAGISRAIGFGCAIVRRKCRHSNNCCRQGELQ
jgi:hypothetical protein